MREILFRGKSINNGKWLYGDYTRYAGGVQIWTHDADGGTWNAIVDPQTVGQYTGLTDKDGVKIFEGDILKTETGCCFAVEWDENNGRFLGFTFGRERRIVYVGRETKAKIICNIHDNPELLERST